jgi:hypothetical protein
MSTNNDPVALAGIGCPLCFSKGTLRPIRLGKRLRAGPWSFVRTMFKSFECTACGATFSTERLLRDRQSA